MNLPVAPVFDFLLNEEVKHIIKSVQTEGMGETKTGEDFKILSNVRITNHTRKEETLNNEVVYFTGTVIVEPQYSKYDGKRIKSGINRPEDFPIKEGSYLIVDGIKREVKRIRARRGFQFHHWTINIE